MSRPKRRKDFMGIDGEGITNSEGRHIYTLLGAGNGQFIENYNGLSATECLDFILRLPKDKILVGFSFDYDVNMFVKDQLTDAAFKALQANHICHIGRPDGLTYRIEHAKRKFTRISLGIYRNGKWRTYDDRTVTIYDVWGFFQCGFVTALITWGISTKEELRDMQAMKESRDSFSSDDREAVYKYNLDECVKLGFLMNKVREKFESIGLMLTSWHGAGAAATAIFRKYNCRNALPKSEDEKLLRAYFGGRIQALQLGHFGSIYAYDIRSAYPYAMSELPLFYNVEPEKVCGDIQPYDVIELEWDCGKSITPFPYRETDASIQFYTNGTGCYHAPEVLAALPHSDVKIKQIWRIPYENSERPFNFIQDLYDFRAVFRAMGDHAHIAIKLGLNSLYGKCAQKKGYKGRKPGWRSYMIAGHITSKCRSMLYTAAMENEKAVTMFCTDGIGSLDKLDLPLGEKLGQWEESVYDEFRLYQAGMYWYTLNGETKAKTRSVNPKVIDWNYCYDKWISDGVTAELEFTSRDFIGYGIAGEKLKHGEWIDRSKTISLRPNKGIPVIDDTPIVRLAPHHCPYSEPSNLPLNRE